MVRWYNVTENRLFSGTDRQDYIPGVHESALTAVVDSSSGGWSNCNTGWCCAASGGAGTLI